MKTALERFTNLIKDLDNYWEEVTNLMDDDLRGEVAQNITDEDGTLSELDFLDRYSKLHLAKYGTEFCCD